MCFVLHGHIHNIVLPYLEHCGWGILNIGFEHCSPIQMEHYQNIGILNITGSARFRCLRRVLSLTEYQNIAECQKIGILNIRASRK